jgi:acyl carrier protein phosphodiesterase
VGGMRDWRTSKELDSAIAWLDDKIADYENIPQYYPKAEPCNIDEKWTESYEMYKNIYNILAGMEKQMTANKLDKHEKLQEQEFDKLIEAYQELGHQLDKLAEYIINNIEGEPKENEGVVDTAIRLLEKYCGGLKDRNE